MILLLFLGFDCDAAAAADDDEGEAFLVSGTNCKINNQIYIIWLINDFNKFLLAVSAGSGFPLIIIIFLTSSTDLN